MGETDAVPAVFGLTCERGRFAQKWTGCAKRWTDNEQVRGIRLESERVGLGRWRRPRWQGGSVSVALVGTFEPSASPGKI